MDYFAHYHNEYFLIHCGLIFALDLIIAIFLWYLGGFKSALKSMVLFTFTIIVAISAILGTEYITITQEFPKLSTQNHAFEKFLNYGFFNDEEFLLPARPWLTKGDSAAISDSSTSVINNSSSLREYVVGILFICILMFFFSKALNISRLGFANWKKGERNPFQGLLKIGAGLAAIVLFASMIIVGTLTFTDYSMKEFRGVTIEKFIESKETLGYLALGDQDSNSVSNTEGTSSLVSPSNLSNTESNTDSSFLSEENIKNKMNENPDWWRYLITVSYLLTLFGIVTYYFIKRKQKIAVIILLSGLAFATFFRSQFLPNDWTGMSFGLLQLIYGVVIVIHWWWRHTIINKPMDWNIDPESAEEDRGPQKHWYGIWGNALFHLSLFIIFGPFSDLMWYIKIPLFWEVLAILAIYAIVLVSIHKIDSIISTIKQRAKLIVTWWSTKPKIGKILGFTVFLLAIVPIITLVVFCMAMVLSVLAIIIFSICSLPFFLRRPIELVGKTINRIKRVWTSIWSWWTSIWSWWTSIWSWWLDLPIVGKFLGLILIPVTLIVLYFFLNINIPFGIVVFTVLPLTFILGGTYEPHIRGRLVMIWFKKPRFDTWLLLGNEYLDSGGVYFTMFASWLWRVKVFLVDFSTWEVEKITTAEIPTKGKDGKVGQTITVDAKITVQRFDPVRYLAMDKSDRSSRETITPVIKRYALGALRDIARNITYDDAKVKNKFQYAIRRQDVDGLFKDLQKLEPGGLTGDALTEAQAIYNTAETEYNKVKAEYNEHINYLKLKIKIDDQGNYVKHDEDGRFVLATFFEYLDWLLLTMTGCRLVEFDVMDVSGDKMVEEAEKQVYKSELEITIRENLGKAEGMRRAAEIAKITNLMVENTNASVAIKSLTDLIGAEKAGLVFQIFKGLGDKFTTDSSS